MPLEEWPEGDRRRWQMALSPRGRRRITGRSRAAHLKPKSIEKYQDGYSRFLGFLAWSGRLDPQAPPEARVTDVVVAAYLDHLFDCGNSGHAIFGRLQELKAALRLLAPTAEFTWLLCQDGVGIRQRLDMTRRSFTIHHPRRLYGWGLQLMRRALTLTGPQRRRVMLRDGLLIALLAARAMRLRSVASLDLETRLRRIDDRWHVLLGPDDVKTGRPITYSVPPSLSAWIDRYVNVERVELLGGRFSPAFWIGWDGKPLGARGIEKRIRWQSAKEFGKGEAFGPHRFRYCVATVAPVEDPEAAANGASMLGITRSTYTEAYDRGERETAARAFLKALEVERAETEGLARRAFDQRRRRYIFGNGNPNRDDEAA
jgi:site-specific recombinase XerD